MADRDLDGVGLMVAVVDQLAALPDGGGIAGQRLAAGLLECDGDGRRLAASLGLLRSEASARKGRRDGLLRALAHDGRSARMIATELTRYRATAWRHDRRQRAVPYRDDDPRSVLWEILRADERVSLTTIKRALRAKNDDGFGPLVCGC